MSKTQLQSFMDVHLFSCPLPLNILPIFINCLVCELCLPKTENRASQVAQSVKNPPTSAGDVKDMAQFLGREDPLEQEMATHSSTLAWKIPQTEEPQLQRVRHD